MPGLLAGARAGRRGSGSAVEQVITFRSEAPLQHRAQPHVLQSESRILLWKFTINPRRPELLVNLRLDLGPASLQSRPLQWGEKRRNEFPEGAYNSQLLGGQPIFGYGF